MLGFSNAVDRSTKLFHSANIGELMGREDAPDLQEAIDTLGIDPQALRGRAPQDIAASLRAGGVDLDNLSGGPALDQIRRLMAR